MSASLVTVCAELLGFTGVALALTYAELPLRLNVAPAMEPRASASKIDLNFIFGDGWNE